MSLLAILSPSLQRLTHRKETPRRTEYSCIKDDQEKDDLMMLLYQDGGGEEREDYWPNYQEPSTRTASPRCSHKSQG